MKQVIVTLWLLSSMKLVNLPIIKIGSLLDIFAINHEIPKLDIFENVFENYF